MEAYWVWYLLSQCACCESDSPQNAEMASLIFPLKTLKVKALFDRRTLKGTAENFLEETRNQNGWTVNNFYLLRKTQTIAYHE
jgi:hypothetical protein